MKEEFKSHLLKLGNLPYLFVGSGFSRRYIGLENWQDLLENVSKLISIPKSFTYYLTESRKDYPVLGQLLSDSFYETFYDSNYSETYPFISEEDLRSGNKDTPLKCLISNYIKEKHSENRLQTDEIEALKKVKISGLITTNWDTLLEEFFPDFKTYIGQAMMFSESLNYGEIFKVHGCHTVPNSLILTTRDYESYNEKNAYLTAKLLTVFVEHPVIFLGYSLSDPNILEIIHSVFKCIDAKDFEKFKDRLIFVEYSDEQLEPTFSDGSLPITNGGFLPIKHIKTNSFLPVYETITDLEQSIPTKVLLKLKSLLYEFVVSNEPNSKIFVNYPDNLEGLENIQAVFGLSVADEQRAERGYEIMKAEEVFRDVLDDKCSFEVNSLLNKSYSYLFKNMSYIPIYKYLKFAGVKQLIDLQVTNPKFPKPILQKIKNITYDKLMPSEGYRLHKYRLKHITSFNQLIDEYDTSHVLLYMHLINYNLIDLEELRRFLISNFEALYNKTDFRKAICFYDRLKYGVDKPPMIFSKAS